MAKRSHAHMDLKKGRRHLQKHKDAYNKRNDSLGPSTQNSQAGAGQDALHPSYFKNERYQKLYKNVLTGAEDGGQGLEMSQKGLIRHDISGIPLSNQMLYEKLDFDADERQAAAGNGPHGDGQLQESFADLLG